MSFDGDYSVKVSDGNGCKNESDVLTVQNLSITESSSTNLYRLFPNPMFDFMQVQSPLNLRISLNDCVGKTIFESKSNTMIDISALSAGLYFAQITDASGNILGIEKVIKANK
jgi:hypothetical protein